MARHLGESLEETDLRVYLCVAASEGSTIQYVKCNTRLLFKKLGIEYRFRSDVWDSLRRLEAGGYITRSYRRIREKTIGRSVSPGATMVTIVAVRPPILQVNQGTQPIPMAALTS